MEKRPSLGDLIADLAEPAEAMELRLPILAEYQDFRAAGQGVIDDLTAYATAQGWEIATDSCEGLRVAFGNDWFLLRVSVHDPILPLNMESDRVGGVREIAEALVAGLKGDARVDVRGLMD